MAPIVAHEQYQQAHTHRQRTPNPSRRRHGPRENRAHESGVCREDERVGEDVAGAEAREAESPIGNVTKSNCLTTPHRAGSRSTLCDQTRAICRQSRAGLSAPLIEL